MDWNLSVVSLIKKATYRNYIYFIGDSIKNGLSATDQIKQNNTERGYRILYGPPFKLFRLLNPVVEEYSHKKYENRRSSQKSFATAQHKAFTANNFENYDLKVLDPLNGLIFLMSPHVIRMSFASVCISPICTCMPFVCQSFALACHLYVTRMYLYEMVCHLYLLVCHPYVTCNVLVCHQYVPRIYSYLIHLSLICGFTMNPASH